MSNLARSRLELLDHNYSIFCESCRLRGGGGGGEFAEMGCISAHDQPTVAVDEIVHQVEVDL